LTFGRIVSVDDMGKSFQSYKKMRGHAFDEGLNSPEVPAEWNEFTIEGLEMTRKWLHL